MRLQLTLGLVMATSALLVWNTYDRGWVSEDEGVFAYMAWRLLEGDVFTRDFADIHPGLLNFFHAGVFAMLGESLLSFRQPLAIFDGGASRNCVLDSCT